MLRVGSLTRIAICVLVSGTLGLFVGGLQEGAAQTDGPSLYSTEKPIRVSLDPMYQRYENGGRSLAQMSTQLTVAVPLGRRTVVRTRAQYAAMGGGTFSQLRGLSDVQGRVTYAQPVGDGSVVFTVDANVPTGKTELSTPQMRTTRFASRNFYDYRVSSFGRGLSLSPGITWALPVTDRLVLGLGASYDYQQGFRPHQAMTNLYVPGNEIGASGGLDYQLTRRSTLGLDITFKRFGADYQGDVVRFDVGNRMAGTLRYLFRDGFTTIKGLLRYSDWEKSGFPARLGFKGGQILPSHGLARMTYRTRLSTNVRLLSGASGHWYRETLITDRQVVGSVRLQPSFELGETLRLAPHGTFTAGSFVGVEGGLLIEAQF